MQSETLTAFIILIFIIRYHTAMIKYSNTWTSWVFFLGVGHNYENKIVKFLKCFSLCVMSLLRR